MDKKIWFRLKVNNSAEIKETSFTIEDKIISEKNVNYSAGLLNNNLRIDAENHNNININIDVNSINKTGEESSKDSVIISLGNNLGLKIGEPNKEDQKNENNEINTEINTDIEEKNNPNINKINIINIKGKQFFINFIL